MASERILMLLGFTVVLVVGISVLLFFGQPSFQETPLAGFAIACQSSEAGISCGEILYPKASVGSCPSGFVFVCTNSCKLNRALNSKQMACPNSCMDVCVPNELAGKLQ